MNKMKNEDTGAGLNIYINWMKNKILRTEISWTFIKNEWWTVKSVMK
jgi:hypothetical protein